jgi:hypothetical protein
VRIGVPLRNRETSDVSGWRRTLRVTLGIVGLVVGLSLVAGGWVVGDPDGPIAKADCSHEDQHDCDLFKSFGLFLQVVGGATLVCGALVVAWSPLTRQFRRERADWDAYKRTDRS